MKNRSLIILAVALVLLAVAAGLYGAGYYLLGRESRALANDTSQEEQKSASLENAARAQATLSTFESDKAALDQYSITKSDIVTFLESLQSTGTGLGSKVTVLSVSDQNDKGHDRLQLSLSITGSFDAVMRTLGAIEYGPYDGMMTSVSLQSAPTGQKGTAWTASAVLSVGTRVASTTTP